MRTLGLASFAGLLVCAFAVQGGDEAALKKERAALQGAWKVLSVETPNGKDADNEGAVLTFDMDGKSLTFVKGNDTKKGTYKLNPAGKPKEIDITPSEDANKTMEAIYLLDKNSLKICLCEGGNDGRPNEFAVKQGKRHILIILERSK